MSQNDNVIGVFNINKKSDEISVVFSKINTGIIKYNANFSCDYNVKNKETIRNASKKFLSILNSINHKDVKIWFVNEDSFDIITYLMCDSCEFEEEDVKDLNDINTFIRIHKKSQNSESNKFDGNNMFHKINNIKYKEFSWNIKKDPEDKIYSYHTFLFPFRLMASSAYLKKYNSKKNSYFSKYSTKKILDELFSDNNSPWKKDLIIDDKIEDLVCFKELIDEDTNEIKDDYLNDYQKLYQDHYKRIQYFHSAPLKAIYGMSYENKESDLLSQYVYRYEGKTHEMELIVGVPMNVGGTKVSKYYRLNLNDIRLKVYNTDIAILIFEVENKLYTEIQDIMNINAFTRRVAIPNLMINADITPTYWGIKIYDTVNDKITKDVKNTKNFKIELKDDIWEPYEMVLDKSYPKNKIVLSEISYTKIIDPIKELLDIKRQNSDNSEENELITSCCKEFNNKNTENKESLFIEPVLDDRMFVCSFIKNDNLVNLSKSMYVEVDNEYHLWNDGEKEKVSLKLKSADKIKYGYQVDYQVAKDLYKVIYIDEKDSSCQSIHMIQQLFEESLYTRWIDWGTIQAITHHSYMMLSTSKCPYYLINNHLELYVEMACMVLAQRASILQFQLFASELTDGLIKENEKMNQERINQLLNLQERYIAFQNQLLFFEVSSEEQAIELYDMLFKSLYIKEENEELRNQLQSLYEATNVNQDLNFNFYAALVAIITVILTAISFAHEAKDIVDIVYPHILTAYKLSIAQWEEGILRFFRWGLLWVAFIFIVSWITYRTSLWLYNIYEKKLSINGIFKNLKDIFKRRS